MTTMQIAALVAVMAVVTFLTRALPFLLFGPENGRFLIPALVILVAGLLLMRPRLEGGVAR